jgi:hypothetical protein
MINGLARFLLTSSISAAGMALALIIACRRFVGLDPSLRVAVGFPRQSAARLNEGVP